MSTPYLKLTAYVGERQRNGAQFTVDAMLDLFATHDVATSVVLRGTAGFGPQHRLRTDVTLSLSEDPPVTVTAVDVAERVATLAPQVADLVGRGLVTVERARRPDESSFDQATQLTVLLGRDDRSSGRSAHVAVGELLRTHGFVGATAFCGVDGTVRGRRRRAGFFSRNLDVPAMVLAVGPPEAARKASAELDVIPGVQVVTAEEAQLCKIDGRLLATPEPAGAGGANARQRLIVHTAASDLHAGLPVHRALIRALLDVQPTAGVTAVHGVWGFQGAGPPQSDRMFQIGRRAPVTTVMIDSADRIAAAFGVVDGLTRDCGVVSIGPVQAAMSIDGGDRRGGLELDV